MATRTISTKLAIEGESQYKTALKGINDSLKTLDSNLKLTKSEFQNHQNSLEALRAKEDALQKLQTELANKVKTCADAYNNAKTAMDQYKQKADDSANALKKVDSALDSMDSATKESGQQWLTYKDRIADAEAKLKELENTSGDTTAEQAKLRKEIDDAQRAMDKLDTETGGAAKSAGELMESQRDLNKQLDEANANYSACEKSVNSWQREENNAQIKLNDVNAELENNAKYLKEAEKSSDGCAKSIDEFGNKTDDAASGAEALYTVLAGQGLVNIISKLAEAIADCVKTAAEFEEQMSTVEAISGATGSEMQELSEVAKEMGATTKFTATEAGEALEYMAMAGWKTEDMIDGLPGIMNLAAASGEDLASTSDIVTDALTAFGMTAEDSGHFADILAAASSNANTNVSMMGETFKVAAPIFGTLGYTAEDAAVAIGLMANAGIKGSEAGTALRAGLLNLVSPAKTAKDAMEKYGITITDSNGEMLPFRDLMVELREKLGGLSEAEQAAAASAIFGKEASSAWLNIINASQSDFDKLTGAIDGCVGATDRMAQTRLDNFNGQVTLLQSAIDGLKTEIGSQFLPILTKMAEGATKAFSWMTDVVKEHPAISNVLTALAGMIGTLIAAFVALAATHVPAVASALGTLKTALSAVFGIVKAHPIGLLVTALAGLAAGIAGAIAKSKAQKEAMMVEKQAAEDLSTTLEDQAKAYEELQKTNEETASSTKSLADSVIELSSTAQQSALDHEALLDSVNELNEAVPGLNLEYDEEAGALNKTTEEILAQVEAQNSLNESQAEVSRYRELLEDQKTIENELKSVQEERAEAERKLREEEGLSKQEKKELKVSIEDCEKAEELYTQQLNETTAAIEEMKPHAEALIQSMQGTNDASGIAQVAAENLVGSLLELRQSYDEVYDSALDSFKGQANAWEELDETVAMSSDSIMVALGSQIQYWQDYNSNLADLNSRQVEGMDIIINAYKGSAEAIAGLHDMTDEELQQVADGLIQIGDLQVQGAALVAEGVTQYSSTAQEMVNNCLNTLLDPSVADSAKQAAMNMLQGYASGVDENGEPVDEAVQRAAQGAIDTFNSICNSSTLVQTGTDTMVGYQQGVNGQVGTTNSTMQTVATGAITTFQGTANSGALVGAGSESIGGFVSGVNSQSGTAQSTMSTLAQNSMTTFHNTANSSALVGAGSESIQGFMTGVNGQSGSAQSTMSQVATSSMTSFKGVANSSALSQAGADSINGFKNGAQNQSGSAQQTFQSAANTALNGVKNTANSGSLVQTGRDTIQGFENGASNKSSSLGSTLANIASNALARFRAALGCNSPSKEFMKVGNYSMEGFIIGVDKDKNDVASKMANMAKTASDSFSGALDISGADVDISQYQARLSASQKRTTEQSGISQIVVPLYINGIYTRKEIIDIAQQGIARKMVSINAAKGLAAT